MKKQQQTWKSAASLAFAGLLAFACAASAQLIVTPSSELGALPLTPTWTPATDSLIANLAPTIATGNFGLYGTGGSAANLTTVGMSIQVRAYAGAGNLEICGNDGSAGHTLVYTLPTATYGYNITNITVYGGWQDAGRDAQDYTVTYSTVDDPGNFKPLTGVNYNPNNPNGKASATRVVIHDLSGGLIAANVYALKFDFTFPGSENNAVGYTAITAQGAAATGPAKTPLAITYSTQQPAAGNPPSWTMETDSLIAGQTPSVVGGGNFWQWGSGGVSTLTDGTYGNVDDISKLAACGSGAGTSVTYTLTNSVNGSDLTNIVVYNAWDNTRGGQYYHISYSTVTAPTQFLPLTGIFFKPQGTGKIANRVAIATSTGAPLAKNVQNLKFDFSEQAGNIDNGASLYAEIIVEGTNSASPLGGPSPYLVQDILPSYVETVVGDQVVFTVAYSNTPPAAFQWQVVKSGVTNDVPNATSSTLTLNNVQVSDSGIYRLKAINSADGTALPSYSTGAPLVVMSTPTAVNNNIIINFAGQNFSSSISSNYFPAWPVNTNSLIYGAVEGAGPRTFTAVGDFTGSRNGQDPVSCEGDVSKLTDGIGVSSTYLPAPGMVAAGQVTRQVGSSVTYTLDTSSAPLGYELTNIAVFGAWKDAGRNEQKYQILYATAQSPTTFVPLVSVDYNPTDTDGQPSVSRTMLTPVSGALARNVIAVKFNFDASPGPKNGWEGYSELVVQGTPSVKTAVSLVQDITPQTASDVVGSQIVLKAAFANATGLQWQKNGTNIQGATTSTLTLNNLKTNDAGAYSLVASDGSFQLSSSACVVTVNAAPTPDANNVVIAIATQTADYPTFTATWDESALASSLIRNSYPTSSGDGDFTGGDFGTQVTGGSGPEVLTDGTFGTIDFANTQTHSWVTCMGSGAGNDSHGNPRGGNYVVYTLTGSVNGYDITNIVTAGGWNDGGRDQQSYTVYYATVANPTYYIPLAIVNYNPDSPVGYSVTRATISSTSGVLASNVGTLMFAMYQPAGENGFSGYSEFAVFGKPSANVAPVGPVITVASQTTNNPVTWTVETPNLIANQLPSSFGTGSFTSEGCAEINLTDGLIGFGSAYCASCGGTNSGSVPWLIFTSTNSTGWNLTNIVVYTMWHDYGRDGQFYNVSYATATDPSTFLPLASVAYNPNIPSGEILPGNRVAISPAPGQTMLATNVYAVKFTFTQQANQDYGWSGYSEIVLQGTNLPAAIVPTLPTMAPVKVSGNNLILTGTGGTPASSHYTWLSTTNLTAPIVWTTNFTGTLDAAGNFSNSIPVGASPASFFKFRMP